MAISAAERLAARSPDMDVAQRFALETIASYMPQRTEGSGPTTHSEQRHNDLIEKARREVAAHASGGGSGAGLGTSGIMGPYPTGPPPSARRPQSRRMVSAAAGFSARAVRALGAPATAPKRDATMI